MADEKGFAVSDPALGRWAEQTFRPEDAALAEIRARSDAGGLPAIHVGKMDSLHLEVLALLLGAKRVVEIGTLAGLSGVALLRGMAPDGVLHTFEFSPHHARVAEESFRRNGFAARAKIHVGPALEKLPSIEREGPFDLVFIDADKVNYPNYLSWAERNLRSGGAVVGDNTFGFGKIHDPSAQDESIAAIREFNLRIAQSGKFRGTILPTEEGLTVGVKI